MNRRQRRAANAAARRARKAQKAAEFRGIQALARGGYMVLPPSAVRQWQIAQEGEVSAVDEAARAAVQTESPEGLIPLTAEATLSPKGCDTASHSDAQPPQAKPSHASGGTFLIEMTSEATQPRCD